MAAVVLSSGIVAMMVATLPQNCLATREVAAQAREELAQVTTIEERSELARTLSFVLKNSAAAPRPAKVIVERPIDAEVGMFERSCATVRARSTPDLTARLPRAVRKMRDRDAI